MYCMIWSCDNIWTYRALYPLVVRTQPLYIVKNTIFNANFRKYVLGPITSFLGSIDLRNGFAVPKLGRIHIFNINFRLIFELQSIIVTTSYEKWQYDHKILVIIVITILKININDI